MIVPRRLHKTAENPPYEIVEEEDPRQAWILCGAGTEYSDEEAKQLGITAYLEAYDKAHAPAEAEAHTEAKAVDKTEVEDKAVKPPEVETKAEEPPPEASKEEPPKGGIDFPPESRRVGGGRR